VLCQVPVEVASFLLNEKRTEIAKIELKQRINVLMVPNKSLETPNYKLERLKHDDPRLDNITASYKMAEPVEDATAVTRRSQRTDQPPDTGDQGCVASRRKRRPRLPGTGDCANADRTTTRSNASVRGTKNQPRWPPAT
jgi:hypothetical protein